MSRFFVALLMLVSASLTGCVSYSAHNLAPVQTWPPQAAAAEHKPTAYLRFTAEHEFNGTPMAGGVNVPAWEKLVLDSYKESNRLSSVTSQQVDSDVYVYASLKNSERGNRAAAFISGFTFLVIPVTFSNDLTLETVYKNRDGKVLGTVSKSETITTWMQLLLIVTLPFNESLDATIKHLSQSSLEEAIKQKLI
ncbi:hypothetical protein [Pseudomonas sp. NA-150]|uniref:hypothetical protein n=1 Tax=Pseudomonas sp. NA-150 TaxID=3367525 RepID=UPI0037CB8B97